MSRERDALLPVGAALPRGWAHSEGWGRLSPRSPATFQGAPPSRLHTDTYWPYSGGASGFALLVTFQGPVDRPSSPDAATSVCTGRQSRTMGGAGRFARYAL